MSGKIDSTQNGVEIVYHGQRNDTKLLRIGSDIEFDETSLQRYRPEGWDPIHYDLLVLVAAVEYADGSFRRRETSTGRKFSLKIPVKELGVWSQPEVSLLLKEALCILTGDCWDISFKKSNQSCKKTYTPYLEFSESYKYVMPYSDGLDSRCVSGLYQEEDILRVRVGRSPRSRSCPGEKFFEVLPFRVKTLKNEANLKSRGFKFAVLTAVASYLSGIKEIIYPESGQGALGPVLAPPSETYPDYRCHPSFLRKVEKFLNKILECKLIFIQPRLWFTKGETISEFLNKDQKQNHGIILSTRTCWQTHRNHSKMSQKKMLQCGLCAACLLRRMSLKSAEISEPDERYVYGDLSFETFEQAQLGNQVLKPTRTMYDYAISGALHFEKLARMAHSPNQALKVRVGEISKNIPELSEHETMEKLQCLLKKHSIEWQKFRDDIGENSFINTWIKSLCG